MSGQTTTFTVRHGGIALKVKLCETVEDVHRAYKACAAPSTRTSAGHVIHAFFTPIASRAAKHLGTVVLPQRGGNLYELVPHEVTHTVIHAYGGVLAHDDESCAVAVGVLCARIFRRLRAMGVAL